LERTRRLLDPGGARGDLTFARDLDSDRDRAVREHPVPDRARVGGRHIADPDDRITDLIGVPLLVPLLVVERQEGPRRRRDELGAALEVPEGPDDEPGGLSLLSKVEPIERSAVPT